MPSVSFLYLFIVDCLRYLLEKINNVQGITLPGNDTSIIDCEFVNDKKALLGRLIRESDQRKNYAGHLYPHGISKY